MAKTQSELDYTVTNKSGRLEIAIEGGPWVTEEDLVEMLSALRKRKKAKSRSQ